MDEFVLAGIEYLSAKLASEPCRKCSLVPFESRDEWARDKERQEIGYRIAQHNNEALPTYCMTCGRYQGIRLIGEMAKRWPPEKIAELYGYFDAVAGPRSQDALFAADTAHRTTEEKE